MKEIYCDGQFTLYEVYANKVDNTYGDIFTDIDECKKEQPNEEILTGYYVDISDKDGDGINSDSPDWFPTIEEARSFIVLRRYEYLCDTTLIPVSDLEIPEKKYDTFDEFLNKEFKLSKDQVATSGYEWRKMELEIGIEYDLYMFTNNKNVDVQQIESFLQKYDTSIEEMEQYGFDFSEYK